MMYFKNESIELSEFKEREEEMKELEQIES